MVAGAGLCSSLRLPACRLLRRPAAAAAHRTSSSSSTSGPPPYYTVRIGCPKNAADTLSESLLCFGATSASMDETDPDETIDEVRLCNLIIARNLYNHSAASNDSMSFPYSPVQKKFDFITSFAVKVSKLRLFRRPLPCEVIAYILGNRHLVKPISYSLKRCTITIIITSIFTSDQDVGRCISNAVDSIGLKELLHYEIADGRDIDWVKNSQETFHPINVADGLWIIPAWRAPIDIEATNIILDPGLAFGTGEHPTTKLCLLLLRENINGGENFFDYGTGSGILCIAALKFGAAISIGVDIDPQAIAAARKNASLNNIRPEKMQLYLPPDRDADLSPGGAKCENLDKPNTNGWGLYQEKGKYDVVIANILLNPLVALVDEITSYAKPGGIVGLSGIICEQVPEIKECYSKYLECMSVTEMDGWACISGKRKACL